MRWVLAGVATLVLGTACNAVFGVDGLSIGEEDRAATASTTSTGTGAGGLDPVCLPGDTTPCYEGPEDTEGRGLCRAGTAACNEDGTGFGECEDQVLPAAEDCGTDDVDEDCDGFTACLAPEWSVAFGGENEQETLAVASMPGGDVIAVGRYETELIVRGVPFAGDNPSGWAMRLDGSTGAPLWTRTFVSGGTVVVRAVATTEDGRIFVAGRFANTLVTEAGALVADGLDAFVAELSPETGAVLAQWSYSGPTNGDDIRGMAITSEGITIGGRFGGDVDFGNGTVNGGSGSCYLLRTGLDGSFIWQTVLQSFNCAPQDVAVGADGSAAIAGDFALSLTVGGTQLSGSAFSRDAFMVRVDAAGNPTTPTHIGGAGDHSFNAVDIAPNGDVVVGGYVDGSFDAGMGMVFNSLQRDALIARVAPSGVGDWVSFDAVEGTQEARDVLVRGDDEVYVMITSDETLTLVPMLLPIDGRDIFLVRMRSPTDVVIARVFGGMGSDDASRLALRPDGGLIASGSFVQDLTLKDLHSSVAQDDAWVALLAP